MTETTNAKGDMEKKDARNIFGWAQIVVTVCLCVITAGFVPWVRSVNSSLTSHGDRILKMESWASEGPRITPDKLRTWKLETQDEMRKEFGAQLAAMGLTLQRIELDLAKHTAVKP